MLLLVASAITIPLGLDLYLPAPEDNPITADKIELGRRLFNDRRLSRDGSISCSSCHDPERAFSDGRRVAAGVFGRIGRRNSPALVNRGYGRLFFWDGRVATLEEQVLKPIEDPNEMDLPLEQASSRVGLDAVTMARSPRSSRSAYSSSAARPTAQPVTSAPTSPTKRGTTPASPGVTAISRTMARGKAGSRRRPCGRWLDPRLTCMMAAWQLSKMSSGSTTPAGARIRASILRSAG